LIEESLYDYGECCKDCRQQVIETVAAKMENLEYNLDMCEYFNTEHAGPYISKVCKFSGYDTTYSAPQPRIREVNMKSFLEPTTSDPMLINEPTFEALETIFDPVTVAYNTKISNRASRTASNNTLQPDEMTLKLRTVINQLKELLNTTVFKKYETPSADFVVNSTITTTKNNGSDKTRGMSDADKHKLLASLISDEKIKEILEKLKALKHQKAKKQASREVSSMGESQSSNSELESSADSKSISSNQTLEHHKINKTIDKLLAAYKNSIKKQKN
jgi:hypothetical protein